MDTDEFEAKMEEAIKQKRPPSSRTEMARQRFTEAMQELADRLAALEGNLIISPIPFFKKTEANFFSCFVFATLDNTTIIVLLFIVSFCYSE